MRKALWKLSKGICANPAISAMAMECLHIRDGKIQKQFRLHWENFPSQAGSEWGLDLVVILDPSLGPWADGSTCLLRSGSDLRRSIGATLSLSGGRVKHFPYLTVQWQQPQWHTGYSEQTKSFCLLQWSLELHCQVPFPSIYTYIIIHFYLYLRWNYQL